MASALYIVKQFFPKVTKVSDADHSIQLEVTESDNKKSRVRDHNGCAMAVACKRKFNADGVIISVDRAYIVKGNHAIRYKLPESVSREIVSFDREAGFRTGTYHLDKISKSSRLGVDKGGGGNNKKQNSGNLKNRFRHITDGIRAALGSKIAPSGITVTGDK